MKKILTVFLAVIMLAVGVNAAFEMINTYDNNFSDVTESNWFFENVKTAYELGFMNGKSDGKFDPNGNVTVIEAITMATRLHAIYNGTEIKPRENEISEYRIDFDNSDNVKFNNAEGKVADGVAVFSPVGPNQSGNYDPGVVITNLNLDSREYNRLKIRLKRDELPHVNGSTVRNEYSEIYFGTSLNNNFSGDKCVYAEFKKFATDYSDWFIIETDLGQHPQWRDTITQLRYDPANDNGIFYIDYIVLSKSETVYNEKWYDMYVDYASDNGIIKNASYTSEDYDRNISREELCNLFACALPEEYFTAINKVAGIPDMDKNAKYSDVILTFYKAGIVFGSDENGNFMPESDIKRSEVAAIINRVALPENRVKGELVTGWMSGAHRDDLEFDDENLDSLVLGEEKAEIKDGHIVLVPTRKSSGLPPFDPRVGVMNISLDAEQVIKVRARVKYESIGEMTNNVGEIFFIPEGEKEFSGAYSVYFSIDEGYVVDAFGWRVYEFDLSLKDTWKGKITGFRFDPANAEGTFTIDYIHFVPQPYVEKTHEQLISEGYTAINLLQDPDFERGFDVMHFEQKPVDLEQRRWQDYCETNEKPLWQISPWWTKYDLFDDRDTTTDKYTIADKHGTKILKYNPEEKSISMRLNCTNIYEGQPHIDGESTGGWWPHLLLNQSPANASFDREVCSAAADRVYATIDLRMTDFNPTTNKAGTNNCSYLIYYYLYCDKAPGQFIYFGLNLFTDTQYISAPINWSPDSAAGRYMYCLRQQVVYDGMENSFQPTSGNYVVGDEWKSLRVDMTPHIDRCVEWANRDNIFGTEITKEDLYFAGANIGFETHGNYDVTFEFKNFGMIAYNKD